MGTKENAAAETRNYGVDLLKIVTMIFVPIIHVLVYGGIVDNNQPLSMHYEAAWLLEFAVYCAVDCYALVSGFVGYGRKHKYSNLIYLYFQVIFYLVLCYTVFMIRVQELPQIREYIRFMFPFAYGVYWYFTAYFCMFFFIPYINLMLEKMEKEMADRLIGSIILLFSIIPVIFYRDVFFTNYGFSPLWITMMYIIGAYIKKYELHKKISGWKALAGWFGIVLFTWIVRWITEYVTARTPGGMRYGNFFESYISPTTIGATVMLFCFFSNLKIKDRWKKPIAFFAPLTFGVYLLHENPIVRDRCIRGRVSAYLQLNPVFMVLAIIVTGVLIFLIGSAVDKVRLELFRLLRIRELSVKIEDFLGEKTSVLRSKITSE